MEQFLINFDQVNYYWKKKYEFYKHEVDFLDFIVGRNGIKINLKKIQKIQEWPVPKNIKNIQKFLNFGNFNRRFIINYSIITILFMEFIKKIYYLFRSQLNRKYSINLKKYL